VSFNMKTPNRGMVRQRWLSPLVAVLLVWPAEAAGQQPPAAPPEKPMAPLPMVQNLKLTALAGDGEMNNLERRVMAPVVVQVVDQNDRPVEGADVVFRFPLNGPGAAFAGQKSSKTVKTNGQGQAAATGWTANGEVGSFQVHVTAAYGNQIGEITISMTNVTRIAGEGKTYRVKHRRWYSSKWVKIGLIAGGAAAAAGIVLAVTGGGGSSGHSITISPGSPTVGAPH
jgi:hypothetical protein